jgi:hypothetical protein
VAVRYYSSGAMEDDVVFNKEFRVFRIEICVEKDHYVTGVRKLQQRARNEKTDEGQTLDTNQRLKIRIFHDFKNLEI